MHTVEHDAYDSCKLLNWYRHYFEEADGKCWRFVGNVQIITSYYANSGIELGETLSVDLLD
jgi:hypothetical protein